MGPWCVGFVKHSQEGKLGRMIKGGTAGEKMN